MSRELSTNREKLANDIWRACDIMRRDDNCGGIMDYLEHLAWVLFLKFLDEQEKAFENEAAIDERPYQYIIDKKYRWSEWLPKAIGQKVWFNGRRATPEWDGDDLMKFVRGELLPYLSQLSGTPQL
jgi:type I restriction enzyme M protein